jgi:CheY-like chemotaxis protein
MPQILAIEGDSSRRTLLRTLVRENVAARLLIVESVAQALAAIDRQVPDVIIAPTLMSPADSAALLDRVRALDHAPYLQVLTIPAFDMLSAPPDGGRRAGMFSRRPAPAIGRYDPAMVGGLIADAVARAREARLEYASLLARRAELEEMAARRASRTGGAATEGLVLAAPADQEGDDRRTALRRAPRELPWLSEARLPWGADISLVNISSSGVLVESGSKLVPGTATELHLRGPQANLVVPVRFVRSEIARIDSLGVRYHAAGTFGSAIDLTGPVERPAPGSAPPPQALAGLLTAALAAADPGKPAHLQFLNGVRELVGARDIQICTTTGSSGRETLYFAIPGDDRLRTNLQVVFDRGHDVTPEQFMLLKAATWMTAAAIELGAPAAGRPIALLEKRVA